MSTSVVVFKTLPLYYSHVVDGAVQAANSGHPGTPMASTVAYARGMTIWITSCRTEWPGRDRFVLRRGHASTPL